MTEGVADRSSLLVRTPFTAAQGSHLLGGAASLPAPPIQGDYGVLSLNSSMIGALARELAKLELEN